jgi:hypothetical protein
MLTYSKGPTLFMTLPQVTASNGWSMTSSTDADVC